MKKIFMKLAYSGIFIMIVSLMFSCSKKIYRDDAVRIKADSAAKYNTHPKTNNLRNGLALRGEVKRIRIDAIPDTCPVDENTKYSYKGYVIFVDSSVKSKNYTEKIPLEDVDLVGPKIDMPKNDYGNINYFEIYNNPLLPRELREVKVDTVYKNPCITPCPCEEITLDMPCIFCLSCPDRQLSRLFLELKPGYSIYKDFNSLGKEIGKDDWSFDAAAGVRFGSTKRWGLGVIVSTGVKTFNKIDSSITKRTSVNLYGRYELIREKKRKYTYESEKETVVENMFVYDTIIGKTKECFEDSTIIIQRINPNYLVKVKNIENFEDYEVRPCIVPFVYGLLGFSIDKFSLDLFKINFSDNCKDQIDLDAPDMDISLPINFGLGIGLEIPLHKRVDLSTDIGFRSISYADKTINNGLIAPTNRRLNAFIFRIGLTF